jgi:hypothetical protein
MGESMKQKNLWLAICLGIMMWLAIPQPTMAQDVFNFTSIGFSIDEDGNSYNYAQTGIATFLSDSGNVFLVASPQYGRAIDGDEEGYGLKFTYGYVLSKSFFIMFDAGAMKIETPAEGSIGYMNVGGSATLLPWTGMQVKGKERVGLTAGFAYNAGTRQLTGVIAVTTVFGR